MSRAVLELAAALRSALSCFEPEALSPGDCARLAEELALTEKACAALRLLASARAVSGGAHRERGFSEGALWMARHSGRTARQARRELETAGGLGSCPKTRTALLSGEVSLEQAAEIVASEREVPGSESELLAVARRGDLSGLRHKARACRQGALEPEELHGRQHRARHLRHWRDSLGMVCFSGALAPSEGVGLLHRLELAAERARRAARATGGALEAFEAYAADALVELCAGSGPRRGERAELVVVCDLGAWRRGHVHAGEVCHLLDGGPVPVAVARELCEDAFVKAVLHDGVSISHVRHFGRHLPAELRTALDLGPVPELSGAECARCKRRYGLEYDHVDPIAHGGETSVANLQALCWNDHRDKTEADRRAGLIGRGPPSG